MENKIILILYTVCTILRGIFPNTVLNLIEGGIGVFVNITILVMYVVDKSMNRYFVPILALLDLIGFLSNVLHFHLDEIHLPWYQSPKNFCVP